ncbi:CDP-glucose 4,6-dehydratase [Prochlorococcus sp. MIT 0801]|uniref:CDP-glucose 4,6-dehydratase n=1 Tax=Prochlorococcus sp. MIT 0801 TaxID=1501269 RepID=UPI0004F7CE64|nr:CDP-glucose 4,6-dehydratase [Prochlorococcus sp. MIT 0801]AIQ98273.1 CDP-glucose 4,6-dehydratase [Prochlorococcus sp. MIT 0801]
MVAKSLLKGDDTFWKNKKVLITGHTGFKGSWLALWLLRMGADVSGFSLPTSNKNKLFNELDLAQLSTSNAYGNFKHYEGDIRDSNTLKKIIVEVQPQVVFHLAAQSLVLNSYLNPIETWEINIIGSLKVLESLRDLDHDCAVVCITSDKVYQNRQSLYGYREDDRLGGKDPYSSSKAAMEIVINSWRESFCGIGNYQIKNISIATARSGNVVGGGDWAENRLVPDAISSLIQNETIPLRNPNSSRPWLHVLEPLSGYLILAKELFLNHRNKVSAKFSQPFNFGPNIQSNNTVRQLIECLLEYWPGEWVEILSEDTPKEEELLFLTSEKSYRLLGWKPKWDFSQTICKTVSWYKKNYDGINALDCCISDLEAYQSK